MQSQHINEHDVTTPSDNSSNKQQWQYVWAELSTDLLCQRDWNLWDQDQNPRDWDHQKKRSWDPDFNIPSEQQWLKQVSKLNATRSMHPEVNEFMFA